MNRLTVILLSTLLVACNESPMVFGTSTGGAGGGGGAAGGGSAGNSAGGSPGAGGSSVPGITLPDASDAVTGAGGNPDAELVGDAPQCGLKTFALKKVPPEILLVLDRSSSMNRLPVGAMVGSMATLWSDALGAVDEVVKATQSGVHWGLKMFPVPTGCMVGEGVEVPVAPDNYTMVIGQARTAGTNNATTGTTGTPTDTAMIKATAYLKGLPSTNPKYIVLATDGQPTCTNGSPVGQHAQAAIASIQAALAAGYKTYVVGIAIEGTLTTLNQMAEAGGVPRNDPMNKFYPVANRADLTAALNTITGQVSNCIFPLDTAPPDKTSVAVKVDGAKVPQGAMDGWSYTSDMATAIQLNGTWCEMVKTKAADVSIVFGCPGVVIP